MTLEIEDIKALDPGKIYAVEFDPTGGLPLENALDNLQQVSAEFGLRFVVLLKGSTKVISVPDGLTIVEDGRINRGQILSDGFEDIIAP
jgi:hypothetical protein